MSDRQSVAGNQRVTILASTTFTTAVSIVAGPITVIGMAPAKYLGVQANFVYGSGGTTVDAYVQTSFDGGVTWTDIMNFNFTTSSARKFSAVVMTTALAAATAATDGSLASNTILSGLLGDQFRVKYKSTGTYAGGTTLQLDAVFKG